MKLTRRLATGLLIMAAFLSAARIATAATVSVLTTKPGAEISAYALGLSYETSLLLPNANLLIERWHHEYNSHSAPQSHIAKFICSLP